MRIRQLDLLRYGHFTDAIIALPAGRPDFQMLLGENEAGKSTTMGGVEDLLFGIPANSPRNFLHEYNAMRVGGLLEKGSDTLKVRRRKGNKDTLLADDDMPIPSGEGALAPFLAGADRRFYTRMFSLDHQRLHQGGKEILQAQDDVGQMLFSASAGSWACATLKTMEAEADALWASRRAAHRKYFQAEERLKSAEAGVARKCRDHEQVAVAQERLRDIQRCLHAPSRMKSNSSRRSCASSTAFAAFAAMCESARRRKAPSRRSGPSLRSMPMLPRSWRRRRRMKPRPPRASRL